MSKNQIVIHLLAATCGRMLGRTRLAKALFLADYHARTRLGQPITTYDYKFQKKGPWTQQIPEDVAALEAVGGLREHGYLGRYGPGHYYTAVGTADYARLTSDELFILHAVVDKCAAGDLDDLIDDVYKTPPMLAAQRLGRGVRIPIEVFGDRADWDHVTEDALLQAERDLDAGRGESLCHRAVKVYQGGALQSVPARSGP